MGWTEQVHKVQQFRAEPFDLYWGISEFGNREGTDGPSLEDVAG